MHKFIYLFLAAVSFELLGCASMPPAAIDAPPPITSCTFDEGYNNGKDAIPYESTCTPETEAVFLEGYSIGRKMGWTQTEIAETQKKIKCLEVEKDLKFSKTFLIHMDSSSDSPIRQRLKELDCSSDTFRTFFGIEADIRNAKEDRQRLVQKQSRIQDLKNKIVITPEKSQQHFENYVADGVDPLDVDLRWQNYITKIGGVDELAYQERARLHSELARKPPLPGNIQAGAFYGFGIGHSRQGRFKNGGLKYALIDSLVLGGILYGVSTQQRSLTIPLSLFGLSLSRLAQYSEVYDYNIDHSPAVQNLRTQISKPGLNFQLAWTW